MHDLAQIARGATEMEALPGTALRLTSIISTDDWMIADIVDTIRHDLTLTGRLIRLANSAASGAIAEISNVDDAVMRVGTGPLLSLALGAAMQGELSRAVPILGLDENDLWRHSVAAALALSKTAEHCDQAPPAEAFVAALLHDVGFLAVDRFVTSAPEGTSAHAMRFTAHQLDHALLGGMIAAEWSLSDSVQQGIAHHDAPDDAPDPEGAKVADFVAVADCVAQRIGGKLEIDANKLQRSTTTRLNLTRSRFTALCESTAASLDEVLAIYS